MSDVIFPTWITNWTPALDDRIMFSDTSNSNVLRDCAISELPVSTASSTAIATVQSDIDTHEARTDNPHSVTKSQVWLSNVDNTSDATKNSATATLTNKTISLDSNTLTWTTAQFNAALTDWDFATLAGTETFTNKTLTAPNIENADTTITRASAWRIAVEWATVAHQSDLALVSKQSLELALTPNYDAISWSIVLDSWKNHYHGTVSWATYFSNGSMSGGWAYDFDWVDDYIELNDGMTVKSLSVGAKETNPAWVFISPNWLNLYVTGSISNAVHQYSLSVANDVSTGTFLRTFSWWIWATEVFFSPDGTKMFLANLVSTITQYTLSSAWDISTAVSAGTLSVAWETTTIRWFTFKPDGTKLYIVDNAPNDTAFQYTLSSAWDITTWTYDSISKVVNTEESAAQWIALNSDWTKMYIVWDSWNDITEYSLSIAWNIWTATTTWIVFYVWTEDLTPFGMCFNSDGTKMLVAWWTNDTIYQYNLYSPYSFSNPIYSNGFTIIADIKADSAWEASVWRILDKSISNTWITWFAYFVTWNLLSFRISDRWAWWTTVSSAGSSITYWTTYRVAVTVSSAWLVTHYINWVVSWTPATWLAPSIITAPWNSRIWNNATATTTTFDWTIWPVRIYSRVLSATEIFNNYLQKLEIDNPPEIPRLTTTMRDAMSPVAGQQIFNLREYKSQVYTTSWNDIF